MNEKKRLSPDIIKKINLIEIQTRRALRGTLIGDRRARQKGTGFEFDQIREYQQGDDVRFIDWNATARMNTVLIKEFIEERSRAVILAVDISGSQDFSSIEEKKREVLAHIGAVLALVALAAHDYVGLMLFSDTVESFIPLKKGRNHVHAIIEQLFTYNAQKVGTDFNDVLKRIAGLKRKDTIIFLISDFIGINSKKYISLLGRQSDLVAIRCLDKNEHNGLPNVGFITIKDIETGEILDFDTRNIDRMASFANRQLNAQKKEFKRHGIDLLDVPNSAFFVDKLVRFFCKRVHN